MENKKNNSMQKMRRNSAKSEKLLKQLANRNRLLILCNLVKSEKTVSELLEVIDLSQSALSQHLAKMRSDKLVSADKRGKQVYYKLASFEVEALLSTLYLIYCK